MFCTRVRRSSLFRSKETDGRASGNMTPEKHIRNCIYLTFKPVGVQTCAFGPAAKLELPPNRMALIPPRHAAVCRNLQSDMLMLAGWAQLSRAPVMA